LAVLGVAPSSTSWHAARAQRTTAFGDLGLPELTVTLTGAGFEVSPAEVGAGWTLITFQNELPEDNFNSADLMLLPPDATVESVMGEVAQETPPAWVYETVWAGGPAGLGGTTSRAVVNLTAGDWLVWSAGESYQPATLTVTEANGASPVAPDLTPDVSVTLQEYAFVGLDEPVPAGASLWEITNKSEAQPHVMVLFALPDGVTAKQLVAAFTAMLTGGPAEDAVDLESVRPAGGAGNLSAGQTTWLDVDLAAGTYGAVCFVPDKELGAPHAMLGMATTFAVE
jgi:hypothetical protein